MNWIVKFEENIYEELKDYLFKNSPKENGCFLQGRTIDNIFFITDICFQKKDHWVKKAKGLCAPTPEYISYACIMANNDDKSLIFVHSHPEDQHPSTFSEIDLISNSKLFNNLKDIINSPIGSMVFSLKGINGVIYSNSKTHPIDRYLIIGNTIKIHKDVSSNNFEIKKDEFDRQIRFMKNKGLNIIANSKIAIIGLGGIGSPLAVMLAKMGVINLDLYDHDRIEIHNLPRIYGATRKNLNHYKIDVVKDHIKTFREDAKINNFYKKIDLDTNLSNYDVIFGCVDNHTTRDLLNKAAYKYAIPYLDSACAIPMSDDNETIQSSVISVNTVLHKKPCLWCSNVLNAISIMEENLDSDEKLSRAKDGYLMGVEKAPSVITLTTAVATFAINRFLNVFDILPGNFPNKMVFDFSNNIYIEPNSELNKKCLCNKSDPFK
jgi:ThiF family